MDPRRLFNDNLQLIDRVVARVCRLGRLDVADAEDFASAVRLHLMEDDYASLRRYEGRCSLVTYLTIIVQRLFMQERRSEWGRFTESTAARKLGDLAMRAEQLVRRDGRSIDEALPILCALDPALTRERLAALVEQFPERRPRARLVEAAAVEDELLAPAAADDRVMASDARDLSNLVSATIGSVMALLPLEERTLVRLHFKTSMTIAEIARALGVAQRPLYRRLERILTTLRAALRKSGVDRDSIEVMIGSNLVDLDFGSFSAENGEGSSSLPKGAELR